MILGLAAGTALSLHVDRFAVEPAAVTQAAAKTGMPVRRKDVSAVEPPAAPAADGESAAVEPDPVVETERRTLTVSRGDTLVEMIAAAGVPRPEAHFAAAALDTVFDLRRLQIGQQVTLLFERSDGARTFAGLVLPLDGSTRAVVTRAGERGFAAAVAAAPPVGPVVEAADELAMAPPPATIERVSMTVGRGDTLVEMIAAAGVSRPDAHYASVALGSIFDLRRLQVGQTVTLLFERRGDARAFAGLELPLSAANQAVVTRTGERDFAAAVADRAPAVAAGPSPAEPDAADPDRVAMTPPAAIERESMTVGRGDTLVEIMAAAGVTRTEAHYATVALGSVFNLRRLQIGQQVTLLFERRGDARTFAGLEMPLSGSTQAVVTPNGERRFGAVVADRPPPLPAAESVTPAPPIAAADALAPLNELDAGVPADPPASPVHPAAAAAEAPAASPTEAPAAAPDVAVARATSGFDADQAIIPLHGVLATGTDDSALEETYLAGLATAPASPAAAVTITRRIEVTVGRGDTLAAILDELEVPGREANDAIAALRDIYDPRRLRAGQDVTLVFERQGGARTLTGLELMPSVESVAVVARDADGGFTATAIDNQLDTRLVAAAGTIESSLFEASNAAGVPDPVLIDIIRAYSFEVDFQRDIRPGDGFEILFEQDFDAAGDFARNGNVLYAVLRLRGRELPIYRFETEDGMVDYYDRDGVSVRRALMRTPIDGARISSRYGMRRHPILGYSRMHRGTDFAARTGTPVYAAGNGVVDYVGRNGGYGRYIRLRHNGSLRTAYAHLRRYARGLSRGTRVEQGQVIGYVGTSGRSTGPHLHYEVYVNGRQVNPMTLDLPSGRSLEGRELAAFQTLMSGTDRQYAEARGGPQVASTPEE
ncbi:MAG: M23 family metallopeptidase [Alphaproteobacteria bacterium]